MTEEKRCTRCRVSKPLSEYTTKIARIGQLKAVCKSCSNQITTKWKEENKDKETVSRRPKFEFSPILKKFLERNVQMSNIHEKLTIIIAYPCAGMTEEGILVTSNPVERVCRSRYGHPTIVVMRSES